MLPRLLDQGHEVIGNECSDLACQQFFTEHEIPYKTEPLPGVEGVLYCVSLKKGTIIVCAHVSTLRLVQHNE